MKTKAIKLTLLMVVVMFGLTAISFGQTNPKTQTTQLFNGKDLSNWRFFLRETTVDPATVFTVQNGVIHVKGDYGYMVTKEVYSNYKLHVEWRYPTELTNSGIFLHMQGKDAIWPLEVEVQLKAGSAGDLVCMGGSDMKERLDKSKSMITKLAASTEKPVGEWNSADIICNANSITVYVNGTLMNKGTNVSITKGSIGLQSEGKDIEFRNVFISPLF